MTLRPFFLSDYDSVVDMYYEFVKEVFSNRKIGDRYFFSKAVMNWINTGKNIVVVEHNDEIVGFSMAFVDDNGGLTEPFYHGEVIYIKHNFRKSKAAYLLYNNGVEVAKDLGLISTANCRIQDGVDLKRHFNAQEIFINLERR